MVGFCHWRIDADVITETRPHGLLARVLTNCGGACKTFESVKGEVVEHQTHLGWHQREGAVKEKDSFDSRNTPSSGERLTKRSLGTSGLSARPGGPLVFPRAVKGFRRVLA